MKTIAIERAVIVTALLTCCSLANADAYGGWPHRFITFQGHVLLSRAAVNRMPMSDIPQGKFIAYFQATNPRYAADLCVIEGHGGNFGEGDKDGQKVYEADVKCERRTDHGWHDQAPPIPPYPPIPLQPYRPISHLCRLGLAWQILPYAGLVGSTCYLPALASYGIYSEN